MLWLALYCPTLSLDCILRRCPEGLEPALAVTDLDGSRRLIAVATPKAEAGGVFAGQSVATALSLLPDLVLVARRLEDERDALTEAALAALRFTPIVSLRASGLVMEISASLTLFGGRRPLKKRIAAAMKVQGLAIAAAEAPTPHGAWLLAQERARRQTRMRQRLASTGKPDAAPRPPDDFAAALDALPIAHLDSARPALNRLDGIGCHTFADLRRLPVKGLARRFGTALVDELARAAGEKPDPQIVFEAPSRFDVRIELMARVESAEALIFASQRLLAQMTGWLTARRAAVRGFTLVLHHDRWTRDAIEPTEVAIALATPSNDGTRLGTLVRERLSRLELKAPVLELSLAAPAIVEEREAHGTLFPAREQAFETLGRLFEKLTARLGPDAMSRLERVADHRPERAWRAVRGIALEERLATTSSTSGPRIAKGSRGSATKRHAVSSAVVGAQNDRSKIDPKVDASASGDRASIDPKAGDARGHVGSPRRSKPSDPNVDDPHADLDAEDPRADDRHADGPHADGPRRPDIDRTAPGCSCGPRPAWLLAEPRQLEVRAHRPVFESLPLELVAGPERIETGWWDDAPATRDYFIGENGAGRLVWIYRERLPVPGKALWYLQGLFG